jgi:hypothetical protein
MWSCSAQFAPSPQTQAEAFHLAGVEPDINLSLILRCELEAHEGTDHAAGVVEPHDPSGRVAWVWWRSGVEVRDPCPVRRYGDDVDRRDNDVCCLFAGHDGEHSWPMLLGSKD